MLTSLGLFPPTLYPFAWLPEEWDHGTPNAFTALLATGESPLYLLIAEPFDPAGEGDALGLPAPFAFRPFAWGPELEYLGTPQAVYLADRSFLSGATDDPPSTPFPAVLSPAYSIHAGIGTPEEPIADAAVTLGEVVIRNGSGDRDALVDYSWGGRSLEIRAGADDWALSQFATVLRGTVTGLRYTEEAIHLSPALRTALFDQLLTRNYYAGTGGREGPAELAGVPKPLALGRCRQVPLRQVNAGLQIWQAGEVVGEFLAVRDIGLVVTPSGDDYPDYDALAGATVGAGEWASCVAEGLVRFGSDVILPTADVDGDPAAGSTVPDIVQWLATTRLPFGARLDPSEIEGGSFNIAKTERGWTVGLHLVDEITMQEAMQTLTRSIGGFATPTRAGQLALGLFSLPSEPPVTLTAADVDDAGPELDALLRPARKVTVGYRPNWRPMTDAEMSETIGSDRELFRQQFRTVSSVATLVQRDAVDYRIDTTLDDAADAQELADILIAVLAQTRRYRVPLRRPTLLYWLGDQVRFVFQRWGLGSGGDFTIVGVEESSDGDRALILWGR